MILDHKSGQSMNLKASYIFALISSLILFGSSCAPSPADTPAENATQALSPANTPKLELTSTSDDVIISFTIDASDGMDEISACLGAYDTYRFVLYRNGQLIRFDEGRYWETRLNQAEIDQLLSDIEATGFPSLTRDGDQYNQDAPSPSFVNTWGGSITVNGKTITITPGQSDYLVEAVTKTRDVLDKYRPNHLQLYVPESINLWVFLEQSFSLGLANPTPEPPVLKWSVDEINLENLLTDLATSKPQVISADLLSFLMEQFKHVPALRWVEQNEQNYLVILCPNFP
jgi:hypothetical protein